MSSQAEVGRRAGAVLLWFICMAFITQEQKQVTFSIVLGSCLQGACPCWSQFSTQNAMSPCLPPSPSNVTTPPLLSSRTW